MLASLAVLQAPLKLRHYRGLQNVLNVKCVSDNCAKQDSIAIAQ